MQTIDGQRQVIVLGGADSYSNAVAKSLHAAGLTPVCAQDEREALGRFRLAELLRASGEEIRIVGMVALSPFRGLFPTLRDDGSINSESDRTKDALRWQSVLESGFVVATPNNFGMATDTHRFGQATEVIFNGLDVPCLGHTIVAAMEQPAASPGADSTNIR